MYGHEFEGFEKQSSFKVRSSHFKEGVLAKIFAYAGMALLITTIVAVGLGILFANTLLKEYNDDSLLAFYIILIASAILSIVLSIVIHAKAMRDRNILIPGILYSICLGVMFSSFVIYVDWMLIAIAFGITTILFFIMFFIAVLSRKRDFSVFAIIGSTMFIGIMLVGIVFSILLLFRADLGWSWTFYWIYFGISVALLVAALSITQYDIKNIVNIAQSGEVSNNLALFCAYTLYADFIYILIRVLRILIILFGNRK